MAFRANAPNPRERRAYADAMLALARTTASSDDYVRAVQAVNAAGRSAKSTRANFGACLASAALSDPDTAAIVAKARLTLDPTETPPHVVGGVGEYTRLRQSRGSPDCMYFKSGVELAAEYWVNGDGARVESNHLELWDYDGLYPIRYSIFLQDTTVNIEYLRIWPDNIRNAMASLALRVV
jgi:hypothetical protein